MAIKFIPDGILNIDTSPEALPATVVNKYELSNALTICKNLSLDNAGLAKTRHGSRKTNNTALSYTTAYALVESDGDRYLFANDKIYKNETEIMSGLTAAKWHGFLYKIRNKDENSIFASNGTDRKRITGDDADEWGIDAPENAPTLSGVDYSITYDWESENLPVGVSYRKHTETRTGSESPTIINVSKLFVSVGRFDSNTNYISTSPDGINWTGRGNPLGNASLTFAIAWNGLLWVAGGWGGTNTLAYSYDGISWIGLGNSIFSSYVRSIGWNGSLFVATGSGGNEYATSPDGINWTGRGSMGLWQEASDLAWNGSLWVAIGDGAAPPADHILYSTTGIGWTKAGANDLFGGSGSGICWHKDRFIAVGGYAGQGHNLIAYSYDGKTWTGLGDIIFTGTSGRGIDVETNGSRLVAVGKGDTNTIAYSDDGVNWTGLGNAIFSTEGLSVTWNGTLWVACGSGTNQRAYSTDGINWTGDAVGAASDSGSDVAAAPSPALIPALPSVHTGTSAVVNIADATLEYIYAWEEYFENVDDIVDYTDINTSNFYSTYFYETATSVKDIKIKYTYVRKVGDILEAESNPSGSVTTGETVYNGINVAWEASADPQVTHVRVYRTLPSSFDYFFESEHEVGTLSATLTKVDTALGTEVITNHNRPPLGSVALGPAFNGYCFILVDNELHYCLPFQPEYWPLEYFIEIGAPQQELTAITFFNGAVYVMNRNEIYLIQGTGADTFFPYPLGGAETGAITQDATEVIKGSGIFRVHSDGVWLFNGNNDRRITEGRFSAIFNGETKGSMPAINQDAIDNSWLFYYKNKLYFGYPGGTSNYPDNILIYNIQTEKFSHYDYSQTFMIITADKTNDRILAVDNAGFVWELENYKVTEDAGAAIGWEVQSKNFSDALYKYFPRFAKYDIGLGQGANATGNILLNDEVAQSHTISSRETKKRHIGGYTGDRVMINIAGSGVAQLKQVELE